MPDIPVQAGDFIPDSAPVAPVAAGTFIPDEIAVGTFVSDAETPQTSAEPYSEYLKKLPESDIVRQFREDTKAGIATDRKLYEDAYALRAGEANWTGSKDLTGRTPDRSVLDVLKAAGSTMWEGFKTQAGEAGSLIANNWAKPGTPEYNRAQQAMGNIVQGMTKGTLEGMHMFDRTASKLYNQLTEWGVTDPKTAASRRRRQQFARDVEIEAAYDDLKLGVPAALPGSGGSLPDSRTQFETDPAKVEAIADSPFGDLEVFLPGAAAFSAGRAPVSSAARALEKTAAKQATLAARMAAKPAEYAARIAAATERSVGASPAMRAALAGGGAILLGGDPATATLAAIVGAETKGDKILKGIRVGAEKVASNLADAGGPLSKFSAAAYRTAASPTAKAIVAGQLANAPFALGAGSEEEFKDALAVGAIASGLGIGGERVRSGLDIRANFFAPHDSPPETRMDSKAFGVSEMLDREHSKVMSEINNSGFNFVEGIRGFLRKKGAGEIYAVSPEGYKAALEELTTLDPALLTSLQGKDISEAAATQGVTLSTKDKNGKPRTVALFVVRDGAPGLGAGHEAVHMLEKTLSKEQLTHIYGKIAAEYGEVGIDNARRKYAQDLGVDPAAMSDEFVLSELFAESGSALLNSVPISQFGPNKGKGWKSTVREIYGLVGEGMRKIGLDVPETAVKQERRGEDGLVYTRWVPPSSSGPKTALGFDPSISGARAVENILQAMALDADVFSSPVETVSTEAEVTTKSPEQATTPTPAPATSPVLTNTPTPAPTPVPPKNVHVTPAQQEAFAVKATPETTKANIAVAQAADSLPTHQKQAFETEYYSAKGEVGEDATIREQRRKLADAAEKTGKKNPLRAIYQKIFVPYRYVPGKTPRVFGFSYDKLIQNVDVLKGWAIAKGDKELVSRLSDTGFANTVRNYLENQSNGYGGDGRPLTLPADTRPGTITTKNAGYSPVRLAPADVQLVNFLMGIEQPAKSSPASRFAARMAAENGLKPTTNEAGVEITNPLYADLTAAGFNPRLLNSVVENLPIDRMTTVLKPRADLQVPAGDLGITRAGFLPANAQDLNIGLNVTDGEPNTVEQVLSVLKAAGIEPERYEVKQSGTEPTLIARIPATDDAILAQISDTLKQDAIAVRNPDGTGKLLGPRAAAWGEFNPEFFLKPSAPVEFVGIQEGAYPGQEFELYNLTQDIEGHPEGSTVSRETLEKAGYDVPPRPSASFLPAAKVQHNGKPLENSLGEKVLNLIHFGGAGIEQVDPRNFGKSGLTPRSEMSGLPRSYFYEQGKVNKSDPVAVRGDVYGAKVSGAKIYDGDTDALGFGDMINREKADTMLQKAGYVGLARSVGKYRQIELFSPTNVQKIGSPTAKFLPASTEKQEKAFKDSKVRGPNGKLLPMFHGTYSDFKKFKKGDIGYHFGTTAAANARIGKAIADLNPSELEAESAFDAFPELRENMPPGARGAIEGIADGARTLPVFLDIKNPLRMRDVGPWDDPGEIWAELKVPRWNTNNVALSEDMPNASKAVSAFEDAVDGYSGRTRDFNDFKAKIASPALKAIREDLKSLGYDGIVYGNEFEGSGATPEEDIAKITVRREAAGDQPWVARGGPDTELGGIAFGETAAKAKEKLISDWGKVNTTRAPKDSYIAFDNAQIMPAFSQDAKARFLPAAPAKSPEFKKWFGKSKVVGPKGAPKVVFHGTPNDFSVFSSDKANVESDLGAGFYFSSTPEDVSSNYAGFGPDLTSKIELLAERLSQDDGLDMDAAKERAKSLLTQHQGATLPVYLKLENPAVLGGPKETVLEGDPETETGPLFDFVIALRNLADEHSGDGPQVVSDVLFDYSDGLKLSEAIDRAKQSQGLAYTESPYDGTLVSNELVRRALEETGFDGIIDNSVDKKFGSQRRTGKKMEGMRPDTVHYIVFNPEQIKSAIGNIGTYDPSNPDIRFLPDAKVAIPGKGLVDPRETRSYKNMVKHLTPAEADKIRRDTAQDMLDIYNELPADEDFETAAKAGSIKKGWYKRAADSLQFIFGDDTERFVGLVAAMSPRQSVQENLQRSFKVWADWLDAGRPLETDKLTEIVERHARIPSRVPNSVRAIQGYSDANDLNKAIDKDAKLSGFKVESFRRNLLGDLTPSTNDTWMAQFANIDQALFGTKSGYLAFNAKIRKVADKLGMKPAEVQETVWSFFKTLTEATTVATPAKEVLRNLTESDILQTPEFHEQILTDPQVRAQLERLGFTGFDSLAGNSNPVLARPGSLADIVVQEGGERRRVVLDRIANRVQKLKDAENAVPQPTPDTTPAGESPFLPGTDPAFYPQPKAVVRGKEAEKGKKKLKFKIIRNSDGEADTIELVD